ncbi:glycosyltransferase family 9 protein [Thermodesulfobacteriota bacterium]
MFIKGDNFVSKDIRSILLIQIGDIGDVVLSFPAIRALRENFPDAILVVAVREKAAELITDCPWTTDVISINKEKRTWYQGFAYQKDFFLRLWKYNFDLAIDLRTDSRGAILTLLSGARQRIGFYSPDGKLWRNRIFTHFSYPKREPGQHMAAYYLNILLDYNFETENIWPELVITEEKLQKARELFKAENILEDRPVIAIQPFSLWQYKEWGVNKYIDLVQWLSDKYKLSIIITGSPDEREKAHKLIKKCERDVHNFAGKTSIGMLAAVLKICRLFIGGDSAGIHISAAVGTPTVSIFGPMSSDAWAPRGPQHQVVYNNMSCVPCHQKGCQGSGFSRCLEELTLNEVIAAVNFQIGEILKS